MKTLAFLLEEPSARALIEGLWPRLLAHHKIPTENLHPRFLVFEGKQDLEANITRKLRSWNVPSTAFLILRDQDRDNCTTLKEKLRGLANQSGKGDVLVRVACHELEAWAIGDWQSIADAYAKPKLAKLASSYANPDRFGNPFSELRKHLPEYQKVDGARRLGKLLAPECNQSTSFRVFCDGVVRLARQLLAD